MGWMLICFIRLYRALPDRIKRRCLFKETCSLFILRVTREAGFFAGCRAMAYRFTRCRPRYSVSYDYTCADWRVEFANGTRAEPVEIADFILGPYCKVLAYSLEKQARTEAEMK